MSALIPTEQLLAPSRLCACDDGYDWAEQFGTDWRRAWQECKRGDWMLWLCARIGVDRRWLVMAAVWCAVPSLAHVPRGERRPHDALWAARRWALGERSARHAQDAAAAARAAVSRYSKKGDDCAAAAALAAGDVALAAADDLYVCRASTAVSIVAEVATGDEDERSLAASADSVRAVIPWSMVRKRIAAMSGGAQ